MMKERKAEKEVRPTMPPKLKELMHEVMREDKALLEKLSKR
jgi:hypothetical protein